MSLNHANPSDPTKLFDPSFSPLRSPVRSPVRGRDRISALHPRSQTPTLSITEPIELSTFDDVDIDTPVRPPPSAHTSAPTHYDSPGLLPPFEEHSTTRLGQGHQRSHSLTDSFSTNFQPFLNRATSTITQHTSGTPTTPKTPKTSLHSPSKSLSSFLPSVSPAASPKISQALSSWFSGSSAPIRVGISAADDDQSESGEEYPSSEEEESEDEEEKADEPNMMSTILNRASTLTGPPQRSAQTPNTTPKPARPAPTPTRSHQSSTPSTRFAWLLSSPAKSPAKPEPKKPAPRNREEDDELCTLNITQSLFPHGPLDPLAPSSFNDLLSAAESLLTRYQNSYRELSSALRDARAEQDAQDDELDESETRARHLKMQLEAMAARASAQDEEMRRMREELDIERRARKQMEEDARRERTASGRRRGNRSSNSDVSVDSGFESDYTEGAESSYPSSETASVFSGKGGHGGSTYTAPSDSDMTLVTPPAPSHTRARAEYMRTFDKAKGSSNITQSGWGCANCEGGAQSAVWQRLAKEREESQALRQRVEVLEAAVDGALGVVGGI